MFKFSYSKIIMDYGTLSALAKAQTKNPPQFSGYIHAQQVKVWKIFGFL